VDVAGHVTRIVDSDLNSRATLRDVGKPEWRFAHAKSREEEKLPRSPDEELLPLYGVIKFNLKQSDVCGQFLRSNQSP
jgi:hypothetical protein